MTEIALPGGGYVDADESVLDVDEISFHEHRALAHRIENWRKANFTALQRSFGPQLQELENVFLEILAADNIDYAQGDALSILGRVVGEGRNDRPDPALRVRVRARIAVNQSQGRVSDILTVLSILSEESPSVREVYPAGLIVTFGGPLSNYATVRELGSLLSETRAAGVGLSIVLHTGDTFEESWAWGEDDQAFSDGVSELGGGVLGQSVRA